MEHLRGPAQPRAGALTPAWFDEQDDARWFAAAAVDARIWLVVCAVAVWFVATRLGPSMTASLSALTTRLPAAQLWLIAPLAALAATTAAAMPWRVLLWLRYRAEAPLSRRDARLPDLTVVIPAYNEGETVFRSIRSILGSDYPSSRLRIIAVDDKSTDDTLRWLERAQQLDPSRVQLIAMPRNGGKREALFAGYQHVTTPVVVSVDSDTVLPRRSLRTLVTPLVLDPGCGAVAGRIDVLNREQNALTRMLGVRYRLGFDFSRAWQSVLGAVYVCPGAFTAWRVDAVRDAWPAWRAQRFMGAPCTNGDDHALTNAVLRRGWSTRYQSNAPARTTVPWTVKRLARMYLRWGRSHVRETLRYVALSRTQLRRSPLAVLDAWVQLAQIPLRAWLAAAVPVALIALPSMLPALVAGAMVGAGVSAIMLVRSERSLELAWLPPYALLWLFGLQWIPLAALLTVRQSRWLTR